jgi:hypothetical protein
LERGGKESLREGEGAEWGGKGTRDEENGSESAEQEVGLCLGHLGCCAGRGVGDVATYIRRLLKGWREG